MCDVLHANVLLHTMSESRLCRLTDLALSVGVTSEAIELFPLYLLPIIQSHHPAAAAMAGTPQDDFYLRY